MLGPSRIGGGRASASLCLREGLEVDEEPALMQFCPRARPRSTGGGNGSSFCGKDSSRIGRVSGSIEGRESNISIKTPRHKYIGEFEMPGVWALGRHK